MERQPHISPNGFLAAYNNLRNAGISLLNIQSSARRRHLRSWVEFKHTLGRRGIRRPRSFLTWLSPRRLGRWRIASGALSTWPNLPHTFCSNPPTEFSMLLCTTHDDDYSTAYLSSQPCIHAHRVVFSVARLYAEPHSLRLFCTVLQNHVAREVHARKFRGVCHREG